MGEVGIEVVNCVSDSSTTTTTTTARHHSYPKGSLMMMMKSIDHSSAQVLPITESPTTTSLDSNSLPSSSSSPNEHAQNPIEAWLPLTESRNGNVFTAVFHVLCSGIGFQALLLPLAFASLGWVWGCISLAVVFMWQLYTTWLLVELHESSPGGARTSRYLLLAVAAFGTKLGKLLSIFPVMYLSGGTCGMLIVTGGGTMQLLFNTLCGSHCQAKSLSGTEWFLVFTCMAIAVAQLLPNLNSISWVSLIGATTAIVYCTLLWALPIRKDRPSDITYKPLAAEDQSDVERFGSVFNAVGIIVLSFRGHNVVLEIQGTLPSNSKKPSHKTMWKAVKISYIQIAMSLFPLAIAGFWAHGNRIASDESILTVISQFYSHDTSKSMKMLIYMLLIINCLCTFQIYAMVVFDNLEFRYISSKKQRCSRWLRSVLRLGFGGLAFLIAVAFPFLGGLAPLIGGMAMPLTYAYPCFMWIAIKKPSSKSAMWFVNLGLGCLGLVLTVLLVVAAIWNLANKGLNANFFDP